LLSEDNAFGYQTFLIIVIIICKEDRTTNFVSTVQYNSDSFSASAFYSYDKRGNISQVTDNGKLYRYQYDELDRLIREDNQALGFNKNI